MKPLVIVIILLNSVFGISQISYKVNIKEADSLVFHRIIITNDSTELNQLRLPELDSLIKLGFLNPDTEFIDLDSQKIININKGIRYKWANISMDSSYHNLPKYIFKEMHKLQGSYISLSELTAYIENIIEYYENSGYPFVNVKLKDIAFSSHDSIKATLSIKKTGRYILIL
ncbi:MAG: hypothetical protein R2771_12190 [Saprospiraceae bacterium]